VHKVIKGIIVFFIMFFLQLVR